MMETPYTYLFIRKDLTPAQQIVQTAHAAHEAGEQFGEHSHMILFGADSEQQLYKIADQLSANHIRFTMFHEPDYHTGYTAICTEPLSGAAREPMRKYTLFKPKAIG